MSLGLFCDVDLTKCGFKVRIEELAFSNFETF